MPGGVVGTVKPSWWDRSRLFCHFSRSLRCTSNLGLIPRPCLACLWGSRQFSQPCDHRWFQIRQCNRASSLLETWWGLGWWARPNKDLAFASLFGTVDTLQSISQDIHTHHYGSMKRWWKELETTILNVHNLSTRLPGIYHKEIKTQIKRYMCENVIVLLSIMKKKVNQSNIKRRLKKKKKSTPRHYEAFEKDQRSIHDDKEKYL